MSSTWTDARSLGPWNDLNWGALVAVGVRKSTQAAGVLGGTAAPPTDPVAGGWVRAWVGVCLCVGGRVCLHVVSANLCNMSRAFFMCLSAAISVAYHSLLAWVAGTGAVITASDATATRTTDFASAFGVQDSVQVCASWGKCMSVCEAVVERNDCVCCPCG